MSSKYNTHLIRSRASYTINEICTLFGTDHRTCSRWINNDGLKVIEANTKPLLIMGSELKRFITEKQQKRKTKLADNEYFCFKCHRAVLALAGSEKTVSTGKTIGKNKFMQMKKVAFCQFCQLKVNRFLRVCQKELKDSE
jgi:hypothetical protein